MSTSAPRVAALGGGHGLATTLTALRSLTHEITAIVTVADNGGSSGRLRNEFGSLPPGDLRMALAALCADDDWGRSWAELMQYRFTSEGDMAGHAVGNLLLAALWNMDAGKVAALDKVGELLKVVGRVLPMALDPLDIEGTFLRNGVREIVRGQVQVATASGKMQSLRLIPENPELCPESLAAIAQAQWITLGPGSWLSSVMPHLLLPELGAAIAASPARKVMIFNMPEHSSQDEFAGFSLAEHLELVLRYLPNLDLAYGIVDPSALGSDSNLQVMIERLGGELIIADLAAAKNPQHHDPKKLASTFGHIFR